MKKRENKLNSYLLLFTVLICLLMIVIVYLLVRGFPGENDKTSLSATQKITVTDGQPQPGNSSPLGTICIAAADSYRFSLSWMPDSMKEDDVTSVNASDLGFITILALFNDKREVVYATSAGCILTEPLLNLEAGEYQLVCYYVTNENDYVTLAKEYLCSAVNAPVWAKNHEFSALNKNGTWNMKASVIIATEDSRTKAKTTGLILGLLVGTCLTFVLLATANKRHRLESPRYDERQELERGRGFRYAFYVFLIGYGLLTCVDFLELVSSPDAAFLHACCYFLAITVYVIYCICHESYFALNEKPKAVMILFSFVGVFNLLISIHHFMQGDLIKDGHFTFNVLNVLCFLMFFVLAIVTLFKNLTYSKKKAADDEEDD